MSVDDGGIGAGVELDVGVELGTGEDGTVLKVDESGAEEIVSVSTPGSRLVEVVLAPMAAMAASVKFQVCRVSPPIVLPATASTDVGGVIF